MARGPNSSAGGPTLRMALDLGGAALVASVAGWTLITAAGRPEARPGPVLVLCLASAGAVVLARWVTGADPGLVPRALAIGIGGALLLGFPDVLRAGGGPTGYGNANSALAALGGIAATAAAAHTTQVRARRAWLVLAAGLAAVVLVTSVAVSLLLALAGLLVGVAVLRRSVAVALLGGALAVSVTLGGTAAIAAGGDPFGLGTRSGLRAELWRSTLDQLREAPGRGVGPGGFAERAPSRRDPDLRWAHHGYLQQAAEQGVLGMLLLVALVAWGYGRLAWTSGSRPAVLAGAASLTVVAAHATVDHVLHHAAVTLTLALLVGWATAGVSPEGALPAPGTPGSPRLPR